MVRTRVSGLVNAALGRSTWGRGQALVWFVLFLHDSLSFRFRRAGGYGSVHQSVFVIFAVKPVRFSFRFFHSYPVMKQRFILFKRAGVFYSEDTVTRKQHSLRTKDEAEALAHAPAFQERSLPPARLEPANRPDVPDGHRPGNCEPDLADANGRNDQDQNRQHPWPRDCPGA